MKQPEDNVTRELPVTKPGRKPIGDRPMTAAERKARSRALQREELELHIEEAREYVRQVFVSVNVDANDRALLEAALDQLTLARVAIIRS